MKKFLLMVSLFLIAQLAIAQIVLPNAPAPMRPVTNPEMVIQFNGQRMEMLTTQRGIRNASGVYSIIPADSSDTITRDKLAVAYSYALRGPVFLTGEVSVKLKPGFQASAISGAAINMRLMVPPDVYIFTVSTPVAVVTLVKQLQLNPAVDWVEPFAIQGNTD
jgi:hypothetical protein